MNESIAKQDEIKSKKKNKGNKANKVKKAKKNKKENNKKNKKSLFTHLKETKAELKKVSWPSKSKTVKDSCVVITAIALAVLFSFIVDSGISFFLKILIK